MNILLFNGSPRKKGNTSNLTKEFQSIAEYQGHTVYTVDSIDPCIHCTACHKTGYCPLKDSFPNQSVEVCEMDAIVIASPIHFFSITPKALGFLTRFYAHDLDSKPIGLILVSGSDFEEGGTSLIVNQFKSIDQYCGSYTVSPFHKVTYDKIWDVSDLDRVGLEHLLYRLQEASSMLGGVSE